VNNEQSCTVHRESLKSYLAYAAFHSSSRRAFADSISSSETKREPTTLVEREGIDIVNGASLGLRDEITLSKKSVT
jgi:hypothetical protein